MEETKTLSIISALQAFRYSFAEEKDFQDGIERALQDAMIPALREWELKPYGTIDFFCCGIGIEAKIKGNRHDVMRQVARYLKHHDIEGVIVASTKRALIGGFPNQIDGKFIRTVFLGDSF